MKILKIRWPDLWSRRRQLGSALSYSTKDFIISMTLYLVAVILCLTLRRFDENNDSSYVAMIFLLQVFLTALLTDGYLISVLMAVVGVLSVDYIFTPPYWAISFTVAGFPLTFLVMLTISVITAATTTRAKQADAAAREAERERTYSNLLRAMSHDIRTPLTGIVGSTNALLEQEGLSEADRDKLLHSANEDAQWLIRIVENLLSITRIDAENAKVNKSPEAVEEIIESAVAKFHRRYPEMWVDVSLPEEVLMVPLDPLLMEQVLLNLLENAVIHGGRTDRIDIRLCRRGTGWICITVEDNGNGIPGEKLERLFDSSAHHALQGDKKRNMGIGLSVCRTVVEAHSGRISARNIKNSGAQFTIELPLEEDSNESEG